MPVLTVIAGPNGSGKSTLTRLVDFDGRERLLDPDAVAKELNPTDPLAASISAGRQVLQRTEEYLDAGGSFAVETTFSSKHTLDLLKRARDRGLETHLIYVALSTPERCIARVSNRFARGGHFVPEADVRRRYARSMSYAVQAVRDVHQARVYDNSFSGHRLILAFQCGTLSWRADSLPAWAESFL